MATNKWYRNLVIVSILFVSASPAAVLRNNALMSEMVSHFQKDNYSPLPKKPKEPNYNYDSHEDTEETSHQKSEKILSLMQNVLCRNFPSIPCKIISEDETLTKLIEKSIQQIKYKSLAVHSTTETPGYLTKFPTINSEDLSNFIQEHKNILYDKPNKDETHRMKKRKKLHHWSKEKKAKNSKKHKESKRTSFYNNRKKIRKFYPHKIKYKDKVVKKIDNSDEKLSMSVEDLDMTQSKRHEHLKYRVEPADPPVWRIDYMKHGEPSFNKLGGYDNDRLKGKLVKAGPSVIVDENVLEDGARREVLHPDVYIKKNYARKSQVEMNSKDVE